MPVWRVSLVLPMLLPLLAGCGGSKDDSSASTKQVAPVEDLYNNGVDALNIRVTPRYEQRLAGDGWSVDLAERFGDGSVRITTERIPVALALLRGWRP